MPYRIAERRPLGQEIKRLFDRQIVAAVTCLTGSPGAEGANRLHDARKRIKKARALLQLARPARPSLGDAWQECDDEMRIANRALGPLADAARRIETLALIRERDAASLPIATFDLARMRMSSQAAADLERATLNGVPARVVRLLDSVRRRALEWNLSAVDADAIIRAVRASHAAARHGHRRVARRPTTSAYHRWRRLVKRERHLFRLIDDLTGRRLKGKQRELAALDGALGELHDIDVLAAAIAADSPLSRHDTAQLLVVLRNHARQGRRHGDAIAAVLDEKPHALGRRLHALWGSPRRVAPGEPSWRRRA